MTGWDDPDNAELYDQFARDHELYRETSRDLVELARLDDAALVVDLACGTGVTTQAILDRVQESANVVALDGSEAMLVIARRRVTGERVRWVCAPAIDLAQHATEADRIVCNSAIWQLDMERAIAAAATTLRRGGRLVFNIGGQFLMLPLTPEELRPRSPTLPHLIQAVAVLDHGFVPPHPALSRRRSLTPEGVADIITRSGLLLDETRTFEYDSPPEAQLAWLSVPVFAQNVLPGMPYKQQLDVLAKAYERFDKSSGAKGVWMAFVAHKP